ncbi:MAG: hypothetical protein CMK32_03030 [Porticoccaceae bacterium]|nr:hypothetical protein [Porticoccaceae bacterium]|tara:strand:+ start:627 stop:974 length:348 start_codon:yes stop_codon:yes gene_type:complete
MSKNDINQSIAEKIIGDPSIIGETIEGIIICREIGIAAAITGIIGSDGQIIDQKSKLIDIDGINGIIERDGIDTAISSIIGREGELIANTNEDINGSIAQDGSAPRGSFIADQTA